MNRHGEQDAPHADTPPNPMNTITAIILAAGRSQRMGKRNKLLLPFRGKTVLETLLDSLVSLPFREILAVTGHDEAAVQNLLQNYPLKRIHNPDYRRGMSTSLKKGLFAADPGTAGFLICLGDMPLLSADLLVEMAQRFVAAPAPAIVVAAYRGRRGNPVIFSRHFLSEMMALEGDRGARSVLEAHPEAVIEVAVEDENIFRDIDTEEDYRQLSRL